MGESVSDHMYRMGIMGMVVAQGIGRGLDINKCVKMALVHDIAEGEIGDITPTHNISKAKKQELEKKAIHNLCQTLDPELGKEVEILWEEYEANETAEAKLVKDCDRLEMLIQAYEYEQAQSINLQCFYDSVAQKYTFKHHLCKDIADRLATRRNEMLTKKTLRTLPRIKPAILPHQNKIKH